MFAQKHLFSPNYSNFVALRGVENELARGGDVRHKKNDGPSPVWKCPKCAKKHPSEMGCGEADAYIVEGEVIPDPSDTSYWLVQNTSDIDAVMGCGHVQEQMGCSKCKEGQRKKKRRAAEIAAQNANGWGTVYNMRGTYRVENTGHRHMGQDGQAFTCPVAPAQLDPSLNCMRDARGNAICSNGLHYPPGCPNTPPDSYFTPGVTPDEVVNGILQGKIPAPRDSGLIGTGTVGGISTGAAVATGAGVLGLGTLLYFLFR